MLLSTTIQDVLAALAHRDGTPFFPCLFPLLMARGGLAGRDMNTLTKHAFFWSYPAIRRAHRGSRHVISWKLKIFISAPAMAAGALENVQLLLESLGLRFVVLAA